MSDPAPSLGLVKPTVTKVSVKPGAPWTEDQLLKIEKASQPDLFGPGLKPLEAMPVEVRYAYKCADPACTGHDQKVLDWELGESGRKWQHQYGTDTINQVRKKWEDMMTAADRDLHFFIGNQHQRRNSFSVLGTFWPKRVDEQLGLFGLSDVDD
ncbi:MAG: hypothetical protein ACLP4W_22015 [Mycobacterium sp.]|uniref:hypothetical protein n=1 Tax=Mycobacterium sp. TaxID=1785 RepID=UPI003F9E5F79